MIACVLVAAVTVRAIVGAGCRPSDGHPLARHQFSGQVAEESTNFLLVCIREYMTSDDVRWLYNVVLEQPTSTGDAALFVHVPTPLGGLSRLKGGYKSNV